MNPEVYELQFDGWNVREIAGHRISDREVRQVLDNAPAFLSNKRGHRAPIMMVGPTFGGRFLTVPLAPVDEHSGLWRPATASDSDPDERVRYQRARR